MRFARFETKGWNLPHALFTCKQAKTTWIKAFFSAEAYVGNNVIRVQTVNQKGMLELSKLLSEFQINHNFYEYQPKKKNYSKVFIISINQKNARIRYYQQIGFYHEKKTSLLKAALSL